MNNKAILIIAALIGALALFFLLQPTERAGKGAGVAIGSPAPDFELAGLDGRRWKLSELRGSVVIVNFWATWCPPCREEMPSLGRLYNKYKPAGNFEVLAILYNDLPEKAAEYVSNNGFDFPVLQLDNRVGDDYGVTGVPETYIIDRKGILRKKFKGPVQFDALDAHAFIDQLLAEPVE